MFGEVTVSARPLRLALLIRPTQADFLKAVQLNATLWGGSYNPILPLYQRAPGAWRIYPGERISVTERTLGYLRAFDPDYLVNLTGTALPPYLAPPGRAAAPGRAVVKPEDVWQGFPNSNIPRFGVGVFEVLGGIYKAYFEQARRHPYRVVLPAIPQKHRALWATVIGEMPTDIRNHAVKYFHEALDIDQPALDTADFCAQLTPSSLTPRRVTQFGITPMPSATARDDAYAYYFDADHLGDLIDLWNLRALGRKVFPLPKQYATAPANLTAARVFIRDHIAEKRQSGRMMFGTRILRGQSATMAELQHFSRTLDLANHMPARDAQHAVGLQHWYPRIWNEWAQTKDAALPDRLVADSKRHDLRNSDGDLVINVIAPDFVPRGYFPLPHFANDITIRVYGHHEQPRADVLPYDHGDAVTRAAGGTSPLRGSLRIGKAGLVHYATSVDTFDLKIPLAEDIFFAWLRDKGYTPELSTCGLLAKQVSQQLKGNLHLLAHERLIQLFDRMTGGAGGNKPPKSKRQAPAPVPEEAMRGADIGTVKTTLKAASSGGGLYRSLCDFGVFQLGVKTQCPLCRRSSWYPADGLSTDLTCPLCHQSIATLSAIDTDNKGAWHLKLAGPFSVGHHADGSYPVLLTHNFLTHNQALQSTPVFSFSAKNAHGQILEADYAMLWREARLGDSEDGAFFAECKSYNRFQKRDFDRMREIARRFPGAILAFVTLRRTLDKDEIRAITAIAKHGRKYWRAERPINPVLVLTGQELFSFLPPPACWENRRVPEWVKRSHSLLELCNATQAIYLNLPHWNEHWRADAETRQRRRIAKPT